MEDTWIRESVADLETAEELIIVPVHRFQWLLASAILKTLWAIYRKLNRQGS